MRVSAREFFAAHRTLNLFRVKGLIPLIEHAIARDVMYLPHPLDDPLLGVRAGFLVELDFLLRADRPTRAYWSAMVRALCRGRPKRKAGIWRLFKWKRDRRIEQVTGEKRPPRKRRKSVGELRVKLPDRRPASVQTLFGEEEVKPCWQLAEEFLNGIEGMPSSRLRLISRPTCSRCPAEIPPTPTGRTPRRKLCEGCRERSNYERKVEEVGKYKLRQYWKARKAAQRARKRQGDAQDGQNA